jgi:C-terminal processing protease CtpA/Prc
MWLYQKKYFKFMVLKFKKIKVKKLIWFCATLWTLVSCTPGENPAKGGSKSPLGASFAKFNEGLLKEDVKKAVLDVLKEHYFWDSSIPTIVDLTQYTTALDVLEALKYKPNDEFSMLVPLDLYTSIVVFGKLTDTGINVALDEKQKLYVAYVFKNSPAEKAGVKRGWEILKINDTRISVNYPLDSAFKKLNESSKIDIDFQITDTTYSSKSLVKAEYTANPVLHQQVIKLDSLGKDKNESVKVGYWVYQNFLISEGLTPKRSAEVQESMEYFQNQGVQELIIDLRYSAGGEVEVAERVCNYIVPAENTGKLMYTKKNNTLQSKNNLTVPFAKAGSLALKQIIILTSKRTRGPAEFILNVMEPYLKVVQIGESTSGMPVTISQLSSFNSKLTDNNIELLAVTSRLANSTGVTDYWDGFPKNFPTTPSPTGGFLYQIAYDSPQFDWGNVKDYQLAAALQYIKTGKFGNRLGGTYFLPTWEKALEADKGLHYKFPDF